MYVLSEMDRKGLKKNEISLGICEKQEDHLLGKSWFNCLLLLQGNQLAYQRLSNKSFSKSIDLSNCVLTIRNDLQKDKRIYMFEITSLDGGTSWLFDARNEINYNKVLEKLQEIVIQKNTTEMFQRLKLLLFNSMVAGNNRVNKVIRNAIMVIADR